MKYFNQDNTDGYTIEQLDELNKRFEEEISEYEDPSEDDIKNVGDRIQSRYDSELTASPKAKKTMKYYFFGYASEYFPSEREIQSIMDGEVKRGKNQVALYCQTDYSSTYAYDSRQGDILWVEDSVRNCAYQLAEEFDIEEIPDSYVCSSFTYWRIDKADRKKINKRLKQLIDSLEG